jgi:hypothetical protein
MRWAGNMTRVLGKRRAYRVLVGRPEGKKKNMNVDGRVILRRILKRWVIHHGLE